MCSQADDPTQHDGVEAEWSDVYEAGEIARLAEELGPVWTGESDPDEGQDDDDDA